MCSESRKAEKVDDVLYALGLGPIKEIKKAQMKEDELAGKQLPFLDTYSD